MCAETQEIKQLRQHLQHERQRLDNYLDLMADMADDEAYVARGNGFCDTKYSDDFLEGQTESLRQQIAKMEKRLAALTAANRH